MATQLLKLRNVPEDELLELHELMEEHEIDVYETSAGNWGISMPALWLRNDEQLAQAKALMKDYGEQRYIRARAEYDLQKQDGRERTFLDIAKENPLKYIFYVLIVGVLTYFSIMPFVSFSIGNP